MNPTPSNENILNAIRAQQRMGRTLTGIALTLGILAVVASVLLAWANVVMIAPMQRLLLEDTPGEVQRSGKNAEGHKPLTKEQLDLRHVMVTSVQGKAIFATDLAIALLASGSVVILVLVVYNRRVTLRQINASLAQISQQIAELQRQRGG